MDNKTEVLMEQNELVTQELSGLTARLLLVVSLLDESVDGGGPDALSRMVLLVLGFCLVLRLNLCVSFELRGKPGFSLGPGLRLRMCLRFEEEGGERGEVLLAGLLRWLKRGTVGGVRVLRDDTLPMAGSVTLPLSNPPPIRCSFCFCACSRATFTWRDGHFFLPMGTSFGKAFTVVVLRIRGGRTVDNMEEVRDEAGLKRGREEEEEEGEGTE